VVLAQTFGHYLASNIISSIYMREFLYVDDMAAASLFILGLDEQTYQANTKLDGPPRKLIDVSRLSNMGWKI
jgi:GDP-L-fucose synthase